MMMPSAESPLGLPITWPPPVSVPPPPISKPIIPPMPGSVGGLTIAQWYRHAAVGVSRKHEHRDRQGRPVDVELNLRRVTVSLSIVPDLVSVNALRGGR